MNNRNLRTAIAAGGAMLVLILDGKTALNGAADGISLCLNTLIPSLFPFFLLSGMLTGALSGQAFPLLRPVAAACGIPSGAESLLAIGFLGGYPVGARNVAQMYRDGQISMEQAARMITICNNAGPSFIFGILGSMFSYSLIPWILWVIHMLSTLAVGVLLPVDSLSASVTPATQQTRLTEALEQAVKVMAPVCGWVVLMRMVLTFLEHWFLWTLPLPVQIAVSGILELANGCIRLQQIGSEGLRFIIASGLLSLGGICVTLQTASVTEGIPLHLYFPGKLLGCSVSIFLSSFAARFFYPAQASYSSIAMIAAVVGTGCIISLRFSKKSSRIQELVGV